MHSSERLLVILGMRFVAAEIDVDVEFFVLRVVTVRVVLVGLVLGYQWLERRHGRPVTVIVFQSSPSAFLAI